MSEKATHSNVCLASRLVAQLATLFAHSSVLDLGCGVGQYGRHFHRHPEMGIRWLGVDGSEHIEEATHGHVKFGDLSLGMPQIARQKWDWVMSLEVGEHVPRANGGEASFMHNLAAWATKGIVLSWALPGQPGEAHVNCQAAEYLQCAMGLLGWQLDGKQTARLQNATLAHPCWWLENSLLVFRPSDDSSSALLQPLPSRATTSFADDYDRATRERCGYKPDRCHEGDSHGDLMWRAPLIGAEWKAWLMDEVAAGSYQLHVTPHRVSISDGAKRLRAINGTKLGQMFYRLGAKLSVRRNQTWTLSTPRTQTQCRHCDAQYTFALNKTAWEQVDRRRVGETT